MFYERLAARTLTALVDLELLPQPPAEREDAVGPRGALTHQAARNAVVMLGTLARELPKVARQQVNDRSPEAGELKLAGLVH